MSKGWWYGVCGFLAVSLQAVQTAKPLILGQWYLLTWHLSFYTRLCCFCIQDSYLSFCIEWAAIGNNFDTDFIVSGATRGWTEMSFSIEAFTSEHFIKALSPLKRTELIQLAEHFKLTIASKAKKGKVCQLIINYWREEELVSDGELEEPSATTLWQIKLEERAKKKRSS